MRIQLNSRLFEHALALSRSPLTQFSFVSRSIDVPAAAAIDDECIQFSNAIIIMWVDSIQFNLNRSSVSFSPSVCVCERDVARVCDLLSF